MLSNKRTPRNPNSSPITEKIKSVSVSGENLIASVTLLQNPCLANLQNQLQPLIE